MARQLYVKGTTNQIVGTLEALNGVAFARTLDENGNPDYSGHTEVWWEEQKTVYDEWGQRLWVDEDGRTYPQDMIEE
ncbi:MAG: hypothetical protein LPL29_13305, partial [Alphaproteobacteria bacterium]|nr:hypothetical protein [Alphaproteobacteria bacterium]